MSRLNKNKLNQLIKYSQPGMVLTLPWLAKIGISHQLAWKYVQSEWLQRVGQGAYKKINDKVTWVGAVAALQDQLKLAVHVGGKTALQLLGRAHFIPVEGIKIVDLFTYPKTTLPTWLNEKEFLGITFHIYQSSFLDSDEKIPSVIERELDGIKVLLASPERAMMEVLYLVPTKQSFEEGMLLMENLGDLRPAIVQPLLEKCHSIKVKRLFLYMAEKCGHPWLAELNLKKIPLGSGKREISGGGEFDSKYQISIPRLRTEAK